MEALILATDGFEDIEYFATRDVLRRGGMKTTTANARINYSDKPILGREKGEIVTFEALDKVDLSAFDVLVIPGGGQVAELSHNPAVLNAARYFASEPGKFLAAICAAPTILGNLGILKGRKYTVFPDLNADFGGTYYKQYAVADGNLITGNGPAAAVTFGLTILKQTMGKEVALKVAQGMYYEGIEEIIG